MGESDKGFEGWAILELMGHRRLGGRLGEEEIAGAAFIRIDVPHPQKLEEMAVTQFYAPQAVYAITPTTEEIARAIARGAPQPVSRWELPALPELAPRSNDVLAVDAEIFDDGVPFDDGPSL